jgi:hypothetical protein
VELSENNRMVQVNLHRMVSSYNKWVWLLIKSTSYFLRISPVQLGALSRAFQNEA